MMKTVGLIVVFVVCVSAVTDMEEWAESSKECVQKNNVVEDDIKKVISGEIKPADVSAGMKCYFLCMAEKEGIVKDGIFQVQTMMEKIKHAPNKDVIGKAIGACKDMKGTDSCDTAYTVMACIAQGKTN